MQKYHIHINANTDEELREELREAAFILAGFTEAMIMWEGGYGSEAKKKKHLWLEKAKEWVEKRKIIIP